MAISVLVSKFGVPKQLLRYDDHLAFLAMHLGFENVKDLHEYRKYENLDLFQSNF